MAKTIDYTFTRGDTKVLDKFRVTDKNGDVITLGLSDQLYFTMKDGGGVAVVKKKIGNGITLGDDGYYHITMEASDTANLPVETYSYDIEMDLDRTPAYVKTLIEGTIELEEDVTTPTDRT